MCVCVCVCVCVCACCAMRAYWSCVHLYHNSLFFRRKNIFSFGKRTKIIYTKIIIRIFSNEYIDEVDLDENYFTQKFFVRKFSGRNKSELRYASLRRSKQDLGCGVGVTIYNIKK